MERTIVAFVLMFGVSVFASEPNEIEQLRAENAELKNTCEIMRKNNIKLRKENEDLKNQIKQMVERATANGNQYSGDANENQIRVLKKPIFGIYLGEPISEIKKRLEVKQRDSNEIADYDVTPQGKAVETISISIYKNRVYRIYVQLKDNSETNYRTVKKELESLYGKASGVDDNLFTTSIDGTKVHILASRNPYSESLMLVYVHMALDDSATKEKEKSTVSSIKKEL